MAKKKSIKPRTRRTAAMDPQPQPKAKRYVPPVCSVCTAMAEGKNYTTVTHTVPRTHHIVRYCKCGFCGNTFKDVEKR